MVISLIIILVALLINALIENQGPVRSTKLTMQVLHQALTEYQHQTGQTPPELDPDNPAPSVDLSTEPMRSFVKTVRGVQACFTMLEGLGSEAFITDDDDETTARIVVDGWENPIVYRRYADPVNRPTADAPFPAHGSELNPRPFFASAGRDQKWGDLTAAQNTDEYKWTRDNILSYELE